MQNISPYIIHICCDAYIANLLINGKLIKNCNNLTDSETYIPACTQHLQSHVL